jgi:hypothetical protein
LPSQQACSRRARKIFPDIQLRESHAAIGSKHLVAQEVTRVYCCELFTTAKYESLVEVLNEKLIGWCGQLGLCRKSAFLIGTNENSPALQRVCQNRER